MWLRDLLSAGQRLLGTPVLKASFTSAAGSFRFGHIRQTPSPIERRGFRGRSLSHLLQRKAPQSRRQSTVSPITATPNGAE